MQRRLLILLGLFGLVATPQQNELSHEAILLARVMTRMSENLSRLPNYTCVQTIERSRRSTEGNKFQPRDRVRLEVAFVSGRELFSWPGARNFEDKDIADMVSGGAIGNGNFALISAAVFRSRIPTFEYIGERIYEGRRTHRWDFRVLRASKLYQLRSGERKGFIGFHGSFWADADTLDIVRLETNGDDIPPELEIPATATAIDYARVPIGGQEFLLPKMSELRMTDYAGESRNLTTFSSCRQYTGESVLSFSDAPAEAAPARPAVLETIQLPPQLMIRAALSNEIAAQTAAVGDPVKAIVQAAVKQQKREIVPKGAEMRGRIVWLRMQDTRTPHYVLGLEFHEIVFGNTRARIHARLHEVMAPPSLVSMTPPGARASTGGGLARLIIEREMVGVPGLLFIRPADVLLSPGLNMIWRTHTAGAEDTE